MFKDCPLWRKVLALMLGLPWCLLASELTLAKEVSKGANSAVLPLPVERFFQRPAILEARLSPSGDRLALTTAGRGDRVGLVVMDLKGGRSTKAVALFQEVDVGDFHWVGDDRLVFSVLDLSAGSGADRRHAPGLFSVGVGDGRLVALVRRGWQAVVTSGNSNDRLLDWNHQLLMVPRPQSGVPSDEVVVGEQSFSADELESIRPLWLNVKTGQTRAMDLGAPPHAVRWWFDSRGEARAVFTHHKGRAEVHWRGPGDKGWRELAAGDLLNLPFWPEGVDDAGTLYVTQTQGPGRHQVLTRFDFGQGKAHHPPIVSAVGFDVSPQLVMDQVGAAAQGVRVQTDAEQTVWFNPEMKRLQGLVDARLPGRVNRLSCRRCDTDQRVVLVKSYADTDPGQYYVFDERASKPWIPLGAVMEGVDSRQMASVEFQRIKARDGHELPVWLTLPPGLAVGEAAPAVVLVHGGPWVRGGFWRWSGFEQFLASRGYLVISPDFRGSSGYGESHMRAGWKQWGRAMQDDVADALLWAQSQGLATQSACIAGASYGGYATLMGLLRHPDLYRCGVAWAGVTDLFLMLKGSWWIDDDIGSTGRNFALPQVVGDVEKDAAMLSSVSPLMQAERIKAPLLLGHGEADLRVPVQHGERLHDALKQAGNPPEWVSYRGEGHSWRQLSTQVDWAQRVERFLARHLKGERPNEPQAKKGARAIVDPARSLSP